ncbi:MAG: type II secretion system GspH family protein, partial [Deltaproteobacteria bacterium]|nr:type II secretion system GspH family protein [Deltaproteobacteria bacterium]
MKRDCSLRYTDPKSEACAGFTLLEVIIVVFILSILAAIVAPRLMGRTDDARIAEAKV